MHRSRIQVRRDAMRKNVSSATRKAKQLKIRRIKAVIGLVFVLGFIIGVNILLAQRDKAAEPGMRRAIEIEAEKINDQMRERSY